VNSRVGVDAPALDARPRRNIAGPGAPG